MTEDSLRRHHRRIMNTTRVGKLTLAPNEAGRVQTMQIKLNAFELLDNVHSMQLFGFSSSAPIGSDVVALALGGETSNACVIASNHNAVRPIGMGAGETMIYDNAGQTIYLSQQGGNLSITIGAGNAVSITADTAVNIICPQVTITGNLHVIGAISSTQDATSGAVSLESHTHNNVQPGSGHSGPPV